MKLKKTKYNTIVATTALLSLCHSTLHAATLFTSDLSSVSPLLELSDTDGTGANGTTSNAVTYSASGVTFSSASGNDSRNYIRTVDTDYGTGNFIAEVTWDGLGVAFVGFGGGNVGTFGTPDWDVADSIWQGGISGSSASGAIQGTNIGRFDANIDSLSSPITGEANPVRLRIVYDNTGNTIQFLADNDFNGTFSADGQTGLIDLSTIGGANYFTEPGDETRFFFGGGSFGTSGATFSDFSVTAVPEPSSSLLLLLGAFSLLNMRNRNAK